jgi:hypothetical protein
MSDFLVSLNKRHKGTDLLDLVRKPYSARVRDGHHFSFPWGAIAVLSDPNYSNNVIREDGLVCCWVGDLIMPAFQRSLTALIEAITRRDKPVAGKKSDLGADRSFEVLNGAFAMIVADHQKLSFVTSPLDFTPVFVAEGGHGEPVAFGTHPDLVACLARALDQVDPVSVGEFMNTGTPSFPHTMYKSVRQLRGGSVYCLELRANRIMSIDEHTYWRPPQEIREGYSESELAEELKCSFLSAVRDRCRGRKVGVLLSGGLDSRLIMASVPSDVECVGLTFCDYINREARTAQRVAECYCRDWHPLFRDNEYIGNNIIGTVRFTGGEYDWIHAHAAGFEREIDGCGLDTVFDGAWIGCFLRAPLADDWVRMARWGGMLPAEYQRRAFDYVNRITPFFLQNAQEPLLAEVRARRRVFFEKTFETGRGSPAEWLEVNPITQRPEVSAWFFNRRVFPAKGVAMDRRLLDFAFKCPIELKLGNRVFLRAAVSVYKSGASIPNANDGVRPGTGHWWRLVQRIMRKSQDGASGLLTRFGKETKIQHSWHDYQAYWGQSARLGALIEEYGRNLEQFDGIVFASHVLDLLKCKDIRWQDGLRLLQLAIWRGLVQNYNCPAIGE